jgi:molybdopterin synthase sulfur carrier subunit
MTANATSKITLRVLCFAQLKDHLGQSFSISLSAKATGEELLRVLRERCSTIAPLLSVSRLAVNGVYVPREHALHEGDEVVVIPPVSGG